MAASRFPRRKAGARRRLPDLLLALAVVTGLAALVGQIPELAEDFAGPAFAIDGDTLDMLGTRVRLKGIDAPELHQTCTRQGVRWSCGAAAKQALDAQVRGRRVACSARTRDRYDRPLALCTVEGADLGAHLVREGWAIAYGRGAYDADEAAAKAAGRGIWSGAFQTPSAWRAEHPRR